MGCVTIVSFFFVLFLFLIKWMNFGKITKQIKYLKMMPFGKMFQLPCKHVCSFCCFFILFSLFICWIFLFLLLHIHSTRWRVFFLIVSRVKSIYLLTLFFFSLQLIRFIKKKKKKFNTELEPLSVFLKANKRE